MKKPIPTPTHEFFCDHCFTRLGKPDEVMVTVEVALTKRRSAMLPQTVELTFCSQTCFTKFLMEHPA